MTSYEVKALLSYVISRVTGGMKPGDRLFDADTGTWYEWRGGEIRKGKPPRGWAKKGKSPT